MKIAAIGATSGIVEACLKEFASKSSHQFYLTGRSSEKLGRIEKGLESMGSSVVEQRLLDVGDGTDFASEIELIWNRLEEVDVLLIGYGVMFAQPAKEENPQLAIEEIGINFTSVAAFALVAAKKMEAQGFGCLAVFSSVAGEMGRRYNYVYGAQKAAVTTLMEGLDARFGNAGPRALSILPGPVKTPMTADHKQGMLFSEPEDVAKRISSAILKGKRGRLYAPSYWWVIMAILSHLPAWVKRRLRF